MAEITAGGSAIEISRREGLRHQTLLWWKWRLGHEQRLATKPGARKTPKKQALTAFLPVEAHALQIASVSQDVIVELPHLAVRVSIGADPRYVAALVHALRAPC